MKIAVITSMFPKLSETFILNQITGLCDRGHTVTIFSQSRPTEPVFHPDVKKYNLLNKTRYFTSIPRSKWLCRLKMAGWILLSFIRSPGVVIRMMRSLLGREEPFSYASFFTALSVLGTGPDVVHVHFGHNALSWAQLKRMGLNFCLVTTFHGHDVNSYPRIHGSSVYKTLFEKGDLFTVNTDFTGKQVEKLGCVHEKIRLLPVGLRMNQFPFQERVFPEDGEIRILTIGRLVEKKGHQFMLQALPSVLKQYPNIRYWIVGEGPLKSKLCEEISRLSLDKHVEFLGILPADQVRKIYAKAHLFILPSVTASDGDMEGQGLVLQEAQAMGLPVISTLHNGIPEGVLDGQSGFLVPEKDSCALAEKILYVLDHPHLWPQWSQKGRQWVERKYDIEILTKQLEDIYCQAVDIFRSKNTKGEKESNE